jgi:hypothetical protein
LELDGWRTHDFYSPFIFTSRPTRHDVPEDTRMGKVHDSDGGAWKRRRL